MPQALENDMFAKPQVLGCGIVTRSQAIRFDIAIRPNNIRSNMTVIPETPRNDMTAKHLIPRSGIIAKPQVIGLGLAVRSNTFRSGIVIYCCETKTFKIFYIRFILFLHFKKNLLLICCGTASEYANKKSLNAEI